MPIIQNKHSFIKIGVLYTISNLAVRAIAFLTTPLFTRLMSQNEFGEWNSVSSWVNIISIILTLNLYSTISRAKYDYKDSIMSYMSSILLFGSSITLFSWAIIELKMDFFVNLLSINKLFIRCILLYCLITPATQLLLCKFRMYNEYRGVILITWVTILSATLTSLILVALMSDKLLGRIIGNYIVVALVNIPLYIYIIQKGKSFVLRHVKYALIIALPLIPHELSGVLLSSSDRIIIKELCGATDTALYSLAYTIALILSVLLSSMNQAWIPWFFDKLSLNLDSSINRIVKVYVIAFAILCIGLMFIGPDLVILFGGQEYQSAQYVIPPVCVALMLQFCYTLYVNIEFYYKKTFLISIATLLATMINIALNYILIPYFGYIAAAYTTMMGYLFMLVFHFFAVSKFTPRGKIFSIKIIVISLIVVIGSAELVKMLYGYTLLRYVFLIAYISFFAVILSKQYHKLKNLLNL